MIIGNEFFDLFYTFGAVLHGGVELNPVAGGEDEPLLYALVTHERLERIRYRGLGERKLLSHINRGCLMAETDYDNTHSLTHLLLTSQNKIHYEGIEVRRMSII